MRTFSVTVGAGHQQERGRLVRHPRCPARTLTAPEPAAVGVEGPQQSSLAPGQSRAEGRDPHPDTTRLGPPQRAVDGGQVQPPGRDPDGLTGRGAGEVLAQCRGNGQPLLIGAVRLAAHDGGLGLGRIRGPREASHDGVVIGVELDRAVPVHLELTLGPEEDVVDRAAVVITGGEVVAHQVVGGPQPRLVEKVSRVTSGAIVDVEVAPDQHRTVAAQVLHQSAESANGRSEQVDGVALLVAERRCHVHRDEGKPAAVGGLEADPVGVAKAQEGRLPRRPLPVVGDDPRAPSHVLPRVGPPGDRVVPFVATLRAPQLVSLGRQEAILPERHLVVGDQVRFLREHLARVRLEPRVVLGRAQVRGHHGDVAVALHRRRLGWGALGDAGEDEGLRGDEDDQPGTAEDAAGAGATERFRCGGHWGSSRFRGDLPRPAPPAAVITPAPPATRNRFE